MGGGFWGKKIETSTKALGRFLVKSLGTAIALTFQAAFFEVLKTAGVLNGQLQRLLYVALTLLLGPVFWWILHKIMARLKGAEDDSIIIFIADTCLLCSACIHMNSAWAFKSLVSFHFQSLSPLVTMFGGQAIVLLVVGTGAFQLRSAVFGPQKENVEKPPEPSGFSLAHSFVISIYAAFPLVTGFYVHKTTAMWWSELVTLCGIRQYIDASAWVMVMEKGTFFFMVSLGAKVALIYLNGKYQVSPRDAINGIGTHRNEIPKESTLLVKSIVLSYAWSMAFCLNLFMFDDMNGCKYHPPSSKRPDFPKYCEAKDNLEFAIGITVLFLVLTFANSLTQESTWWSFYDKKLHDAAFPTLVGWAWASFVFAHLGDLTEDIEHMKKSQLRSEWATPAFYLATWAFLLAAGAGIFNQYKNVYRDLQTEHGDAPTPKVESGEGSERLLVQEDA